MSMLLLILLSASIFGTSLGARDCRNAVSHSLSYDNKSCHQLCQSEDPAFELSCHIEKLSLVADGTLAQASGQCYSNIIYGFSDKRETIDVIHDVESAPLCQQLCQENPDCVHFMYRVAPAVQERGKDCFLKSLKAVQMALSHQPVSQYCDLHLHRTCATAPIVCLRCDGIATCAVASRQLFAGPKFCPPGRFDGCKDDAFAQFASLTTPTPSNSPTSALSLTTLVGYGNDTNNDSNNGAHYGKTVLVSGDNNDNDDSDNGGHRDKTVLGSGGGGGDDETTDSSASTIINNYWMILFQFFIISSLSF